MQAHTRRRFSGGFTLVELIITLGVLAILAGSAAVGWSQLADDRERRAAALEAQMLADALNAHNAMVPPERAIIDAAQSGGLTVDISRDYRALVTPGSAVYPLTALGTYDLSVVFTGEAALLRALANLRYIIPTDTAAGYIPLFCGRWEPVAEISAAYRNP